MRYLPIFLNYKISINFKIVREFLLVFKDCDLNFFGNSQANNKSRKTGKINYELHQRGLINIAKEDVKKFAKKTVLRNDI